MKLTQIVYRLYYALKNKNKAKYIKLLSKKTYPITMIDSIDVQYHIKYIDKNTFSVMNQTHKFEKKIDWNYNEFGLYWPLALNGFDFLHQPSFDKETGLRLMCDYVEQYKNIRVGYRSYCISLRNLFWIRFIVKHNIHNEKIDAFLYDNYKILLKNLEYNFLGNHLLENAFSLLIGAYYFRNKTFYHKAYKLLKTQLKEQILDDGGHFELSPVYHQTMLYRLLDCINIVSNNKWIEDDLLEFMNKKATDMLSWLKNITFPSETVPFFNDTFPNSSPSSAELFLYAERLDISHENIAMSKSNFRVFEEDKYKFIFDIGGIEPSYQCGHAHADTFGFVMEVNNKPFFVDTGCSTYEIGKTRMFERGTSAHNTVVVNGENSSQVWASHRVGKRAHVTILEDSAKTVTAKHNGYKNSEHIRTFKKKSNEIIISDKIKNRKIKSQNTAFFHLDYNINDITISNNIVNIQNVEMVFEGAAKIYLVDYEQVIGINTKTIAKCICVDFNEMLKTTIVFK